MYTTFDAFRISVREATPDHEKKMYNYNFKDKWDKSLAQAGMNSSLEPPEVENEFKYGRGRRKSRRESSGSMRVDSRRSDPDSAWGMKRQFC